MGRRETKKEATKKKILDVSLQLFQKIGFGQARDVEREARSRPEWRFEGISVDLSGIPRVTRLRRA